MSSYFNSSNLLNVMNKWKIQLSLATVVIIALSILFSSPIFITPLFRSYAVIYPSNLIPYSSETPSEQMLQLLKSDDISFSLIKKFQLAKHYNTDTTNPNYLSQLKNELSDNVNIKKTEFESIVVEAYDTDPNVACNMVREIINLLNLKARSLQREKSQEVVIIYQMQLQSKKKQIDSIEQCLNTMREDYNIYEYEVQVKEYTRAYLNGVNAGKGNHPVYTDMFNNLTQHGGDYLFLQGYLASIAESYAEIKIEYDKAISDLNKELTYTNLVTSPYPADRKAYPICWLIVTISTVSGLVFMLILIAIYESLRENKKKTKTVNA